jgi:hypothetical protein
MEVRRKKKIAFSMGLHARLGVDSIVARLDPEILKMVFEVGGIE